MNVVAIYRISIEL